MNIEISDLNKNRLEEIQPKEYRFLGSRFERIVFLVVLMLICAGPIIFGKSVPSHADWHIHMERAYNFKRCFWQGQWLPRWIDAQAYGYGLPVFNYYAPLVYYFYIFIDLVFRNAVLSIKWIYILPMILSIICGYIYLRKYCSAIATTIATVFIALSPAIHMYVYNNNWPGSVWAIPFLFLLLYGIDSFENSSSSKNLKSFLITSLSYGLLCLTHIATAFTFTLLLVPYFLLNLNIHRTKAFVKNFFLSLGLGGSLAAFYLLPAILEKNLVHADEVLKRGPLWDFSKNFLYTFLDRDVNEGYAWAIFDHRYYEVGNALFGLAVFICIIVLVLNMDWIKRFFKEPFRVTSAITMFTISFLMMTPLSFFIWLMIKPLHTIQFPWRFTSLIIPFGALLLAYSFDLITKLNKEKRFNPEYKVIAYTTSILLAILFYVDFINAYRWKWVPEHTLLKAAKSISWSNEEYRPNLTGDPNWRNIDLGQDFSPQIDSSNSNTDISVQKWISHSRIFEVFSEIPHSIRLKTFYFPGWNIYVDGKKIDASMDPKMGSIIFNVAPGKHEIRIEFELTPIRKYSIYISLFSLLVFIYLSIKFKSLKKDGVINRDEITQSNKINQPSNDIPEVPVI